MHDSVKNLLQIEKTIVSNLRELNNHNKVKIIAVSKTFNLDKILPLINHGHENFGENKVQEAIEKWTEIKKKNLNIKLHMIGKLQTNKVKFAVKLFDYIHSVDSQKLAKKISDQEKVFDKKIKIFIQVNIGGEIQKSGINYNQVNDLVNYCKNLNLNVIGFMCIPPEEKESGIYFEKMSKLNKKFGFSELSMGMSSDYIEAIKNNATYVRIGSSIFGKRR